MIKFVNAFCDMNETDVYRNEDIGRIIRNVGSGVFGDWSIQVTKNQNISVSAASILSPNLE